MKAKKVFVGLKPQGVKAPKPAAPRRGDIIRIDFSPSAGREMRDPHPALVISDTDYNAKFRFVVVLAISTVAMVARENNFAVNLQGTGTQTTGVVVADKLCTLDLEARIWETIEKAPPGVLDEAIAIAGQVIGLGS